MVRHTNKRKNSRRRRQTRGRITQKGGFNFFGFGGGDSIDDLQEKLINEKDPIKIAEIKKKIALAKAKEQYDNDVKQIENGSSAQSNMGNQYQNLDSRQSGNQEYGNQEYGNKQYGNKQYGNQQFGTQNGGGSRRRRRRHRRK